MNWLGFFSALAVVSSAANEKLSGNIPYDGIEGTNHFYDVIVW